MKDKVLIAGSFNLRLAERLAKETKIKLAPVEYTIFPNLEKRVKINSDLKNKEVFVLQSLAAHPDESLMELLILTDAAKNMGAKKITGIIPWLAYSPQDKIFRKGEPLTSKLVANLMKASGLSKVVLLDVHSPLNLDYFKEAQVESVHLSALEIFVDAFNDKIKKETKKDEWVVLCIDEGSKERSREFAKRTGLPIIFQKKSRDRDTGNITYEDFTGNVDGKIAISFDDFISTGGSLIKAAEMVKEIGAKKYVVCITHGLLCNKASEKIKNSKIDQMFLTDSYPVPEEKQNSKISILSCSKIIAKAISS